MLTEKQALNLTGARSGLGTGRHWFRFWMPYLFQRLDVPGRKHAYIPLNRNYKPLGQIERDRAEYEALAASHGVTFTRDPATFEGIWTKADDDGGRLWLYDDRAETRRDYFARLEKLMANAVDLYEA